MNRPLTSARRRCSRGVVALTFSALSLVVQVPGSSAASPSRPQSAEPAFGASLTARMSILYHAIALDSLTQGQKVFFPEAAYVAMKTGQIPSPASDYVSRLVGFYRLDLAAYHSFLFSRGPTTFLGINVNPAEAVWIHPLWCENSIGYWHVPGVRLIYRQRGVVRSVAVASLISWHGVWYVVHLGPNPRPRNVGTVDLPSLGRGVAGPAGGC